MLEWRKRFSADQASAFNRYGWSYYTKDWYSEWSPVYTNAWASMCVPSCEFGAMELREKESANRYRPPRNTMATYLNLAKERGLM